jgi:hypothetical protein
MNEPIHEQQLNPDTTFKHLNPTLNPKKRKGNEHKGFMFNQKRRNDLEGEGQGKGE